MKKISPVYILIRTSKRPLFFRNMIESVKIQTYPNIITIVHTDDPSDKYVEGDIIIRSNRDISKGRGHYNLYCNKLLQSIPDDPGWYHFIDDDDLYYENDVIERTIEKAKDTHVNVVRSQRWGNTVWPKNWGSQMSYQTECIFMHTNHKNLGSWWSKTGGDHNYTRQLTDKLPINWIDGIIICKAQKGKGRGRRYDLNEYNDWKKEQEKEKIKNVTISTVGKRLLNIKWVEVIYRKRTTGRSSHRGKIGEIRFLPFDRNTQRLQNLGKIEILREVSKEQMDKIKEVHKNFN